MSTKTFAYWGMLYSPIRERLRTHKVPEFSYSLAGVFFCLQFSTAVQRYTCTIRKSAARGLKKNWWHDIPAQVRFISASFEIVWTDTFPTSTKMRRLSVLQRARDIETSHSLMSLHGRFLA